jgi:hypothetical protein
MAATVSDLLLINDKMLTGSFRCRGPAVILNLGEEERGLSGTQSTALPGRLEPFTLVRYVPVDEAPDWLGVCLGLEDVRQWHVHPAEQEEQ